MKKQIFSTFKFARISLDWRLSFAAAADGGVDGFEDVITKVMVTAVAKLGIPTVNSFKTIFV